ncbi:MAG: NAD-dependent epimerase/dehydratase family protein [Treponemataceae bacterium]
MNKIVEDDLDRIINSNLSWESFEGKSILITGANGILPAYMVMTLLTLNKKFKEKCRVYALVRNIEKAKIKFKNFILDENLIFMEQDICDKISIKDNLHYIIHAASQASPKYYLTDPVGTLNANVIGTNNILELCREKKVLSFLFFSSGEVYGEASNKRG